MDAAAAHPRLTEGTFSTIKKYFNEIAPGWDKQQTVAPAQMFYPIDFQEKEKTDFLFKIVLIGDSEVGKSRVLSCIEDRSYVDKRTIGVEYVHKWFGKTKLQIWDTAGQERYLAITRAYYKDAHAIIIMFDTTKKETFDNIEKWYEEAQKRAPRALIILVGNKSDLEKNRAVTKEQAEKFASENRIKYVDICGTDKTAVDQLFEGITVELRAKHKNESGLGLKS